MHMYIYLYSSVEFVSDTEPNNRQQDALGERHLCLVFFCFASLRFAAVAAAPGRDSSQKCSLHAGNAVSASPSAQQCFFTLGYLKHLLQFCSSFS